MSIDATALTALIISIVALVIAVFQLLAQIVGTVEGYRHCQASVIGKWTEHRKREWSWSQFRYDTLFSTPDITTGSCHPHQKDLIALDGSKDSRAKSFCDPATVHSKSEQSSTELVSWLPLLDALHDEAAPMAKLLFKDKHDQQPRGASQTLSWPRIRIRQRSWDLMPPDVVRPFATTTVSDIVILTCRMGVKWKDFRPTDGIMEGEGGGHVFSATKIRGLGTMLSYIRLLTSEDEDSSAQNYDATLVESSDQSGLIVHDRANGAEKSAQREGDEESVPAEAGHIQEAGVTSPGKAPKLRYAWTPTVDKFWFGILPGNPDLKLPDFHIGTIEDIHDTLRHLDPENRAIDRLWDMQKRHTGYLHGFCDIVPMVAPWLCPPGTTLNWYPRTLGTTLGLTWYHGAYHAFIRKLREHNKQFDSPRRETSQSVWVEEQYDALAKEMKNEWDGISQGLDARSAAFYNRLREVYDDTTRYFQKIKDRLSYLDLVTAHLREAPMSYPEAEDAVRQHRTEEPQRGDDKSWRGEAMVYYWRYIPRYEAYLEGKGCRDVALVREAWIVLIFRAFLWMRAHIPQENVAILPTQWHGSRLPIYIT